MFPSWWGIIVVMRDRYLYVGGGLVVLLVLLFLTALFTGTLPRDKDGYHYEYADGHIIKIKTFAPPPWTRLMIEVVDGKVMNYYGTTTEQQ
jgi:hypothetical protein